MILITVMFLLASIAYSDFYDSIHLLKISSQDERACKTKGTVYFIDE